MTFNHLLLRIEQALPQRQLKIVALGGVKVGWQKWLFRTALLIIMMLLLLAYSLQNIPDIFTDKKFSETAQPVNYETSGQCQSKLMVIISCTAKIQTPNGIQTHNVRFIDFKEKDYDIKVLVNPNNPNDVRLSLTSEKFTGRILFSAVFIIISMFLLLSIPFDFKTIKQKQQYVSVFNRQRYWKITVLSCQESADAVTYSTLNGNQMKIAFEETNPICLFETDDNVIVLAFSVTENGKEYVLPIDDKLKIANFSSSERVQFQSAIESVFSYFSSYERIKSKSAIESLFS